MDETAATKAMDLNEGVDVFRLLRRVIPWIALAIVAFQVGTFWFEFRAAQVGATPSDTAAVVTPAVGDHKVVALVDGVKFRAKPATNAAIIEALNKGDTLEYRGKSGVWYKARDGKGQEGWVTANTAYTKIQ